MDATFFNLVRGAEIVLQLAIPTMEAVHHWQINMWDIARRIKLSEVWELRERRERRERMESRERSEELSERGLVLFEIRVPTMSIRHEIFYNVNPCFSHHMIFHYFVRVFHSEFVSTSIVLGAIWNRKMWRIYKIRQALRKSGKPRHPCPMLSNSKLCVFQFLMTGKFPNTTNKIKDGDQLIVIGTCKLMFVLFVLFCFVEFDFVNFCFFCLWWFKAGSIE